MKLTGRKIVVALCLAILVLASAGFGIVGSALTAHADSNLVYTVDSTTAAGGVYARSSPHTNDTQRISGYGVYPGEQVQLLCGVTDGDSVGPYNNTTWHFITDLSNPGEGNFWLNDHYIDSPNTAGQLAPGESTCPNESSNPLQSTNDQLSAAHLPCTPLLVIGARGSGNEYQKDANGLWGLDATLSPLVHGLIEYYGKDNVTAYGLPYPADPINVNNLVFQGGYTLSVQYGVEALVATAIAQSQACPFQLIDLVGYSQGADVVNNAVPQLPQQVRDHINGVVTFGDPQFNGQNAEDQGIFDPTVNGVEGIRSELPADILPRARSYCSDTDIVCNFSPTSISVKGKGHFEYAASYVPDAEQFLESLGFVNSGGF